MMRTPFARLAPAVTRVRTQWKGTLQPQTHAKNGWWNLDLKLRKLSYILASSEFCLNGAMLLGIPRAGRNHQPCVCVLATYSRGMLPCWASPVLALPEDCRLFPVTDLGNRPWVLPWTATWNCRDADVLISQESVGPKR